MPTVFGKDGKTWIVIENPHYDSYDVLRTFTRTISDPQNHRIVTYHYVLKRHGADPSDWLGSLLNAHRLEQGLAAVVGAFVGARKGPIGSAAGGIGGAVAHETFRWFLNENLGDQSPEGYYTQAGNVSTDLKKLYTKKDVL